MHKYISCTTRGKENNRENLCVLFRKTVLFQKIKIMHKLFLYYQKQAKRRLV